jgi:hypothetical protein
MSEPLFTFGKPTVSTQNSGPNNNPQTQIKGRGVACKNKTSHSRFAVSQIDITETELTSEHL